MLCRRYAAIAQSLRSIMKSRPDFRHQKSSSPLRFLALALALLAFAGHPLQAEPTREPDAGVDQRPGEALPLELEFQTESGETVRLEDYFRTGKPVLLVPSYYKCPRLCSYIFKGVQNAAESAAASGLAPGEDYTILSVSFDPREGPELARQTGESYRSMFETTRVNPERGWQFLTGTEENISPLMDAIGYRYKSDGKEDFSHTAAIVMASPRGKISRYMFGIEFDPSDYRLSLVEASNGTIGNAVDAALLYCFRFDPQKGKYTADVIAFMRIGGVLTLAFVLGLLFFLWRREKSQKGA